MVWHVSRSAAATVPWFAGRGSAHGLLPAAAVEVAGKNCSEHFSPQPAADQIEALAAGLPVIGAFEGGATTFVENGVEGYIVRGRDPQDIAEAMLRVARDRELCRRMGEAAHKKGAVRNTWQDYGDRLLAEYTKRLNR